MRTTLRLPDELLDDAKRYALERGTTLTAIFEEALREKLARPAPQKKGRIRLSTFSGRGVQSGVDLHDSAALLDLMESDRPARS
jgi:hypothetical protein